MVQNNKRYNFRARTTKKPSVTFSKPLVTIKKNALWDYFRNIKTKSSFVSATGIKNYLLKDPLLDWLKLYDRKIVNNNPTNYHNTNFLCEMGLKFENEVYNYLFRKYPKDCVNLGKQVFNVNNYKDTIKSIKDRIPIICQATLFDKATNIGGCADLLIRGDWFKKLFNIDIHDDHYKVIDIKWTTLNLCANGINIRNDARMPSYKGQLAIYNYVLGKMQDYLSPCAYILAKSYKYTNKKQKNSYYNCFSKLGVIDYETFDNKYIMETVNAINWIRDVRTNGHMWDIYTNTALFPNMNNKFDDSYGKRKFEIANKINDMTLIWNISKKHRDIAFSKNIYSYKDVNCTSENLGIGGKYGNIIDKIISINRDSCNDILLPKKIKNNDGEWKSIAKKNKDFFIDFETLNSCFCNTEIDLENSKCENLIFLIGVGHIQKGIWVYEKFRLENYDNIAEKTMVNKFVNYIKKHSAKKVIKFYYWSSAEKTLFDKVNKKFDNLWDIWANNITWINLCQVFIDEPIVIKGAKNFSLKEVANNLYNHGLIKSKWPQNGISNGLDALFAAGRIYSKSSCEDKEILLDNVIKYNEIDCKVVYEILNLIRKKI